MTEPDERPSGWRLPSPETFTLILYVGVFFVLPAIVAYKGFVYILGTLLFAIGLRPHVEALVAGRSSFVGLRWRGRSYGREVRVAFEDERRAVKVTSWILVASAFFVVPLLVWIVQRQGTLFVEQLDSQLPVLIEAVRGLAVAANDALPSVFPAIDADAERRGWSGLSGLLGEVFGDAAKEFEETAKGFAGQAVAIFGGLFEDWVKLVISAIIVGTLLGNWRKEVAMHRGVIARGISDPQLRRNVLRYGELYQEGVSLFMIGYLEVGLTLSVLYVLSMIVLPLGLGLGTILFFAVVLGFVTAIPKIGGILSMALAFFLMLTSIQPGLGWFGYEVVSFGWGWDVVIRTVAMMVVAKMMGFLEAYNYTPEIIGARLGMTKVQIIATILVWAVGAGFFGMIWGVLLSLAFQAALRLSGERAALAEADRLGAASEPAAEAAE